MVKVKITCGTTYCGCPSETIEMECYDMAEYNSHEFSTEILDAIFNGSFPHYFVNIDTEEISDEEEENENE